MDLDESTKEYRELIIKNFSPEGLVLHLERELISVEDEINFHIKKHEALKSSIKKLKQP